MADDRLAALVQSLKDRGERVTTARHGLLATMVSTSQHRSADQLAAEVARTHPAIHRATIYRTLETLRRLGIVEHTHLGHGPAVYHLAEDVHQHLVCEGCGWVVEAPATLFSSVERRLRRDFGFEMRPNHFAVVGRCRQCAARQDEISETEPHG